MPIIIAENLWNFDEVVVGQAGPNTKVTIRDAHIATYAQVAQNPHSLYLKTSTKKMAMPTMVLTYAPLLRDEIAQENGFIALEESKTARRQTPFAKCEARWFHPVYAGDTLTGSRCVLEKYVRRGSQFVTFRISATNQDQLLVAQYDYTCVFSYVKGQRPPPSASASITPSPASSTVSYIAHPISNPNNSAISSGLLPIGHLLIPLTVSESQEVMLRKNEFRLAGKHKPSNIHTDEDFANKNIFAGMVNSGPATMSYVDQFIENNFPLGSLYNGGRLLLRAITPFRSGDTVTFSGTVVDHRVLASLTVMACQIKGYNQRGELVCLCEVDIALAIT